MARFRVELRCLRCGKIVNSTKEIENRQLAEKIRKDALFNPLLGWCNECDRKPFPFLVKVDEPVCLTFLNHNNGGGSARG